MKKGSPLEQMCQPHCRTCQWNLQSCHQGRRWARPLFPSDPGPLTHTRAGQPGPPRQDFWPRGGSSLHPIRLGTHARTVKLGAPGSPPLSPSHTATPRFYSRRPRLCFTWYLKCHSDEKKTTSLLPTYFASGKVTGWGRAKSSSTRL